ncbi:Beta-lactamase regulatory protein BlaB [Streptomyces sp. RB5]|uniref:Beta-lactamase regulatory protein BlaB n=1 Tax=Streptomyces smaragdinus TaxID=2585196 RepID=A0A7K0CJ07_9ACTN|nr:serine hydrolase [Streptomyces smaragdinus]MQY13465.1 Beta-lactamase regulatory protein BlaB [Streptomyces smaragdinus]
MRSAAEEIRRVFEAVGADGQVHAVPIGDSTSEVDLRAGEPAVIASLFKVPLVLEFARQCAAGQLDPRERVRVTAEHRLGGWGTGGCADDVELSLRDLAFFALSITDNAAADLLLDRVGLDTVRLLAQELGLTSMRLTGGSREVLRLMLADVGAATPAEFAERYRALDDAAKTRLSALDPARTNSAAPRDITRLLRLVWRDEAGTAQACAVVRDLMGHQVFRHRLPTGFPADVRIAAKTGTLPGLHIEAGVIQPPGPDAYVVAVFARTRRPNARLPEVDAAIGTAARLAVEALQAV